MAFKESWRKNIKNVSVETVHADTVLPTDTEVRHPLCFEVKPCPEKIIDLSGVRLFVKFKLEKKTDTGWVDIGQQDKVCPYNNFAGALFSDCFLSIGGLVVDHADGEYSRGSYLKNLLFEPDSKKLEPAWFFYDKPGKMDIVTLGLTDNYEPGTRMANVLNGKTGYFISPIYLNVMQSDGFLPDTVGFSLRFAISRTVNCLLHNLAEEIPLRVVIQDAELLVPRVKLSFSIPKSVTVPYEMMRVYSHISPKSAQSFTRSIATKQLPKKIAIAIVTEQQYYGKSQTNSLKFTHHKVKNVKVRANGNTYPRQGGMNLNFTDNNWLEGYISLFEELKSRNVYFHMSLYDNEFAIYGVNLHNEGRVENGSCDIDIEFAEAPAETLVVLMFCFYDSKFTVDSKGQFVDQVKP